MSKTTLSIYLPMLLPENNQQLAYLNPAQLSIPNLTTILSRAKICQGYDDKLEHHLFTLFNIPVHKDFPLAAFRGLTDGLDTSQDCWMCIDPVSLLIDHNAIYLKDNLGLNLSEDELSEIRLDMLSLLKSESLEVYTPHSCRWYAKLNSVPDLTTTPLPEIIGKDVSHYLPKGNAKTYWHGLMTELQMLLHVNASNQKRKTEGKEDIASLWFWGIGELPTPVKSLWQTVYTANPIAAGMALHNGINLCDIPNNLLEINQAGNHLIIDEPCREIVWHGDVFEWREKIEFLDNTLLKNCLDFVAEDNELVLFPGNGKGYQLNKKLLKKLVPSPNKLPWLTKS